MSVTTVNYVRWLRSYVGHQRLLQLAASAFIQNSDGQVLLGRRADVMLWAPPSGVVQLDESPSATIIREVLEETGLHVRPTRLIGVYTGSDFEWTYTNGDQAQIISIFFACTVYDGALTPDRHEFLDVRYFPENAFPPLMPRYKRMLSEALEHRSEAFFD